MYFLKISKYIIYHWYIAGYDLGFLKPQTIYLFHDVKKPDVWQNRNTLRAGTLIFSFGKATPILNTFLLFFKIPLAITPGSGSSNRVTGVTKRPSTSLLVNKTRPGCNRIVMSHSYFVPRAERLMRDAGAGE